MIVVADLHVVDVVDVVTVFVVVIEVMVVVVGGFEVTVVVVEGVGGSVPRDGTGWHVETRRPCANCANPAD